MKKVEYVFETMYKQGQHSEDPTVAELLEWMRANEIPLSARLYYHYCGSHDFVLEWDESEWTPQTLAESKELAAAVREFAEKHGIELEDEKPEGVHEHW